MAESTTRWNPWRALRARDHLELRWADLAPAKGLLTVDSAGIRIVWLHRALSRRWRSATLAHELVHDERGIFYDRSTPALLVSKEERAVKIETSRRLVPPEELAEMARWAAAEEPIELWELAEAFDVPEEIVALAVQQYARGQST